MNRPFTRSAHLASLRALDFDVLVVGGGATGLGIAVDAASRGYRTALVEAHDFAKCTSSRSTKLVHGGVRYLEQMQIGLVTEALVERAILCENAPHLAHDLAFIVPRYHWWEGPFYGVGLKLYDALAGKRNFGSSRSLSREETIAAIPGVREDGLLGGIEYHDAQFDDARMALALARTAASRGAVIVTRARCEGLVKDEGQVVGAEIRDVEGGQGFKVRASIVVNATGVFVDQLRAYDDPAAFDRIVGAIVDLTVTYLSGQIEAGVEAVQLFDSWAGSLSPAQFERWVIAPNAAIVERLRARHPGTPIIGFPKGAGAKLVDYAAGVKPDAIGLDETLDPVWADRSLPAGMPVQGNLDPLALLAGGTALDDGIDRVLTAFPERPHVFNLGHGIGQHTPIAHVEQLIARVRGK